MAHETTTTTAYSEFGHGHFEDAVGRLYRVVSRDRTTASSLLPWDGLEAGLRVAADVRVAKRNQSKKVAIAKGELGPVLMASLLLPRVGDVVSLKRVKQLKAEGAPDDPIRARVELGRQKAPNSPVARLVLKIVD